MATFEYETIDSLDLCPRIQGCLQKAHLTNPRNIMTLSNLEIQQRTNMTRQDAQMLKDRIAQDLIQFKPVTAHELLQAVAPPCLQPWKLSSGCKIIDSVLRGGFLSGVITEISGESACGKTQLCLQLCLSVQLSEQNVGGAVYICTENVFPSKRLQQMIRFYKGENLGQGLGDHIFIEHVADLESLDFCINKKLITLLRRGVVRLVVIDSITALFRCHYDATQTVGRAKHLTSLSQSLRQLAFQYRIPVICVNQVSANISAEKTADSASIVPALGLTWANQITCRLLMSRLSEETVYTLQESWKRSQPGTEPTFRKLQVVFAPHIGQQEMTLYIDHSGIRGIPDG